MGIQILKQKYKDAIREDVYLKAEIAAINKVSTWTVDRWRTSDHPLLTTATNLEVIRKRLNLSKKVELTEPKDVSVVEEHVSAV